jgi:hypothetical protein
MKGNNAESLISSRKKTLLKIYKTILKSGKAKRGSLACVRTLYRRMGNRNRTDASDFAMNNIGRDFNQKIMPISMVLPEE